MSGFFRFMASVEIEPGRCRACLCPGAPEGELASDILAQ
jgi:hypothetical protein